jgi:hypothetical protein
MLGVQTITCDVSYLPGMNLHHQYKINVLELLQHIPENFSLFCIQSISRIISIPREV